MRVLRALYGSIAVLAVGVLVLGGAAARGAATPPLPPSPALPAPLSSVLGGDPPAASSAQEASASQPSDAKSATTATVASEMQLLVTAEVNLVRRQHGRRPLTASPQLARAGREHARQLALAGYFSHDWSDGRPFGSWIKLFYPVAGARTWRVGENLAWSTPQVTAQQAVQMWLDSPEHRRILLDKGWRQVGLGVIRADGAGGVYGGQSVVILAAEFGIRR